MELISRELPKDCEIIDTGDWHIGPLNCNIEGIKQTIAYIKNNKNVFVFLKGDLIDAIKPNDKRYAHCVMGDLSLMTAQNQADKAAAKAEQQVAAQAALRKPESKGSETVDAPAQLEGGSQPRTTLREKFTISGGTQL